MKCYHNINMYTCVRIIYKILYSFQLQQTSTTTVLNDMPVVHIVTSLVFVEMMRNTILMSKL